MTMLYFVIAVSVVVIGLIVYFRYVRPRKVLIRHNIKPFGGGQLPYPVLLTDMWVNEHLLLEIFTKAGELGSKLSLAASGYQCEIADPDSRTAGVKSASQTFQSARNEYEEFAAASARYLVYLPHSQTYIHPQPTAA